MDCILLTLLCFILLNIVTSQVPVAPTMLPTYSPTTDHPVVECKTNDGSGCCSLCNSQPCTMTFSSDVTYIGMNTNILLITIILF